MFFRVNKVQFVSAFDKSYHSYQVKPLIWVEAQVERHSKTRVEIMVKARSQFKERRYGWFL